MHRLVLQSGMQPGHLFGSQRITQYVGAKRANATKIKPLMAANKIMERLLIT